MADAEAAKVSGDATPKYAQAFDDMLLISSATPKLPADELKVLHRKGTLAPEPRN